ncbi:MAG: response regulator transcription factor [Ardenticatenaceae bacterium]|nr:response regulator transcription factor [Ardenticatenaceae bacterium]
MTKQIIIITNQAVSAWVTAVTEALNPFGQVTVTLEKDAQAVVQQDDFDLILIDASTIDMDAATLIQSLHLLRPTVPIVVNTLSPTWRRAREAFMAGAVDYIRRSLDKEKIVLDYRPFLCAENKTQT